MSLVLLVLLLISAAAGVAADFNTDMNITWGDGRAIISNNGLNLQLSMDNISGSGCESKAAFLYGRFELSSAQPAQDEVDLEFLGNLEGQPYKLNTNVFTEGKGNREQRFHLWFDPTGDFHNYSILWTPNQTISYIDGIPIRGFMKANSTTQLPYVEKAMTLHTSLWDGSDWATDGGRIKVDWSKAPFIAHYRNLKIDACFPSESGYTCGNDAASWIEKSLSQQDLTLMHMIRDQYMIYNYCTDPKYKGTVSDECSREAG
ncbi:hypothetical protein J5N97_015519 [Dioscorea zingiberensis]|uniref:Xyloglucan endotransglucosylase/hydrolase n=1 Tax=Dioscorea zingiberensis TaxID=325984 RepID=A0A9D5CUF2_9LILI|nr:hypothetical protein J5N97_015519 [Dioscorea zingiberensis]